MKTILTLLITLFFVLSSLAQNGINYKAVIKDNNGDVVANQSVTIQFTVLQGASNVYQETHSVTTNADGLIIINIGDGTTSDVFADIDWSADEHFLNVQVNTGSGLVDLGTTQFMSVPYALNVSGLEKITENGFTGWRLKGRNPDHYGDISHNAVDLSYSNDLDPRGATGNRSFATGFNTTASGDLSTAMGFYTNAEGQYATTMGILSIASEQSSTAMGVSTKAFGHASTAMGNTTEASGTNSTAMGSSTVASGDYSTAMGSSTEASGAYATATGSGTEASGRLSTAMGLSTIASAYISTAFGRNNISGGSPTLWIGTDPLFEIGNGTSVASRSNAMTVLKNGNTGIGTSAPQDRLHIANGRLRIGTETIEDTGSNQLSVGASLIPDADNAYRLGNSSSRWISVWALDGTINTSDRRDKENITDLNYGLKEIQNLKPVAFNWKKRPEAGTKLGLIAQDLQKIIPEAVMFEEIVYSDEDQSSFEKKPLDRLGVYYSDLIPVLVKAIQEQQDMIQKRDATISNLVERVERLESGRN